MFPSAEKKLMLFFILYMYCIKRLLGVSFQSMACSQVLKFLRPRSSLLFHP
jgi:hypothetical protein